MAGRPLVRLFAKRYGLNVGCRALSPCLLEKPAIPLVPHEKGAPQRASASPPFYIYYRHVCCSYRGGENFTARLRVRMHAPPRRRPLPAAQPGDRDRRLLSIRSGSCTPAETRPPLPPVARRTASLLPPREPLVRPSSGSNDGSIGRQPTVVLSSTSQPIRGGPGGRHPPRRSMVLPARQGQPRHSGGRINTKKQPPLGPHTKVP